MQPAKQGVKLCPERTAAGIAFDAADLAASLDQNEGRRHLDPVTIRNIGAAAPVNIYVLQGCPLTLGSRRIAAPDLSFPCDAGGASRAFKQNKFGGAYRAGQSRKAKEKGENGHGQG